MRLGLAVLRLNPKDFWAMTPRELAAAAGLPGEAAGWARRPERTALNDLCRRFPDWPRESG